MKVADIPKIVLHLHLDGSIDIDDAYDWAKEDGFDYSRNEIINELQVDDNCHDLNEYLTKFDLPCKLLQTCNRLEKTTYKLFLKLAKLNVIYAEVRLAPMKHINGYLNLDDVVISVINGMHKAMNETGIIGGIILSLMRGDAIEFNTLVINLAKKYLGKGVVGIDLAGAEGMYPTKDYLDLFKYAHSLGIPYTIHAGEALGGDSITAALNTNTLRIGHGIKAIDDKEILQKIIDDKILLEVCVTSNYQTKAVDNHPIEDLYKLGVNISINTDNDTVSNIDINKEYTKILNETNLTIDDLIKCNINSIDYIFANINVKNKLREKYNELGVKKVNNDIIKKAEFCLNCVNKPCSTGCPLNNDIPEFINLIKNEKYQEAYEVLSQTTVLASICGRICPHERQCQGKCVRKFKSESVAIGDLEAFVGDLSIKNNWQELPKICKNKKVAIIGSGPSGLTCAAFLRKAGYDVTIYEKHNYLGGLLYHGIPDFRLDRKVLNDNIKQIIDLGIKVNLNKSLGNDFSLDDLKTKYDAIFLAIGANVSKKMQIPGEDLEGVYGANELLEYGGHPDYKDKTVLVSGCGNSAMDISRTIKRMGAKDVYVVYRKKEENAPAEIKEINGALKDGVKFLFQTNIIAIKGDKSVESVELIKTELEQVDDNISVKNIEGSNYEKPCDYVVMAIGANPDNIVKTIGLELENGKIKIDELGATSDPQVFSGGDVAGTKSTVAFAARAGRNAALAIIKYLEACEDKEK